MAFKIAIKMVRYLAINLTEDVQDLYESIYWTLFKDTEKDLNKWRDLLTDRRLKITKNVGSPPGCSVDRCIAIAIKIPTVLGEFDRLILKLIYKSKRPRIVKTFLKEEAGEAEKKGKKEEETAPTTWKDDHKTLVTEMLILMQEQTHWPTDPKRKLRNRPTPGQKPDPLDTSGRAHHEGRWWQMVPGQLVVRWGKSKNAIPTSCLP